MSRTFGYELARAYNGLRREMERAFRELNLSVAQYAALRGLQDSPGMSSADLARHSFVTPQTMNAIVLGLEDSGWIERHPHPAHGRVRESVLTTEGRRVVSEARTRVQAVESRMTATIAPAERLRLTAWLGRCADALGE